MTARTHDLAALTALGAVLIIHPISNVTLGTAIIGLLANQIGGIAPDIDQPAAPFWRQLPIGGVIGRFIDRLLGGHRFLTHSLLGLGLLGAAVYALLGFLAPLMPHTDIRLVWWAFMIGAASHLIVDSFTKEGVPWLLPLPFKFGFPPLRSLRITTGKWMEHVVIFPALAVVDLFYFFSHYRQLLDILRHHLT